MQSSDGMHYAPKGKPAPVVKPGEFVFAAVGLDHGHIGGMCNGLMEAGATLKWIYDPDPAKVEQQLRKILPPEESNDFCHRLVLHGRAVCIARRPQCQSCVLRPWCDHFAKSGQTARGTEGREPA